MSISEIARHLGLGRNSVAKYLEILQISGQVDVKISGTSKIYTISQRVPVSAMLGFSLFMIIMVNRDGRIIQVNDLFLRFTGVSRDNLIGRRFSALPIDFLKDIPLAAILKDSSEKKIDIIEKKVFSAGNEIYLRIKTASTVFDDGNEGITIIIEDITERKKLEFSLRESEERYRNVVETQTEFICRFRPDGTHVFANEAYCRYFGKTCADLIGKKFRPIISPDDQTRVREHFAALTQDHPVLTIEHRIVMPDGDIRWQEWVDRAIFDNKGTIVEYQAVGRDITEKKKAEAQIRQDIADIEFLSQKSYEFLELSPDADIYRTICQGVRDILPKSIVLVNSIDLENGSATTRSVLGEEERVVFSTFMGEDIIGRILKIPPGAYHETVVKAVTSGKIVRVPGNLFIATHMQVPVEVCAKIEDALNIGDILFIGLVSHGIILANVVIMLQKGDHPDHVDLIEAYIRQAANALLRQKTAENLKESENLYRSIMENMQDVYYRTDKDGILLMASPSWTSMLGYDVNEGCIGQKIADKFWFEPSLREKFLKTLYEKGFVRDYEIKLKHKNGTPVYVSGSCHLYYDESGTPLGVEGIFRDISERHASAEKIRDFNSQMEFLSRKVLDFIRMEPSENMFGKIVSDLKELVPGSMILVNSCDPQTGIVKVQCAEMNKRRRDAIIRALGKELVGTEFLIDANGISGLRTGILHNPNLSLFDIAFGNIPEQVCNQLESELEFGDIYAIGFVRGEVLLGNAAIFLDRGVKIPDLRLVEMYARVASIVLQRRVTEESVKNRQEFFSEITELFPVPVSIIDPEGKYLYLNNSFSRLFGYTLKDFQTGRGWFLLAYPEPDYRKKVIATWKSDLDCLKEGKCQPRIFTVRCKDSTEKEIIFRPAALSKGRLCIVYENTSDRTEEYRKNEHSQAMQAPEELQEIKEEFREKIQALRDSIGDFAEENIRQHQHILHMQNELEQKISQVYEELQREKRNVGMQDEQKSLLPP
ncbi:MAG: PAS domain S-box protein [Methanoregula sp.]